jgi:hypothetical protein
VVHGSHGANSECVVHGSNNANSEKFQKQDFYASNARKILLHMFISVYK